MRHQPRWTADEVIVALGGCDQPIVPPWAQALPLDLLQVHSEQHRNPQALPPGAVLVVGCGQWSRSPTPASRRWRPSSA